MLFLLLSFLVSALLFCLVEASSFPQPTVSSNSTRGFSPSAAVTGCANQCFRDAQPVAPFSWSSMVVTATVTAETVLLVVNNRTNITRTSTITNPDIDPNGYAPATTNGAGTVTTSVILQDGSTSSTRYIAYPTTGYEDYSSTYSFCGTLKTTISGSATCLTYQNGCDVIGGNTWINDQAPTMTYPSHPPIPVPSLDLVRDPKGWTYLAVDDESSEDPLVSLLFPDLGLWACTAAQTHGFLPSPQFVPHGPRAKSTALFLTVTSTSVEADGPTPTSVKNPSPNSETARTTRRGQALDHSSPPRPGQAFPSDTPLPTPVAKSLAHGADVTIIPDQGPELPNGGDNTGPAATAEPAVASSVNSVDATKASIIVVPEPTSTTDGQGRVLAPTNEAQSLVQGADITPVFDQGPERPSAAENMAHAATLEPVVASSVYAVDATKASIIAVPEPISNTDGQGRVLAPTNEAQSLAHGADITPIPDQGPERPSAAEDMAHAATLEPVVASSVNSVDATKASNTGVPEPMSTTDGQGRVLGPANLPSLLKIPGPIPFVPVSMTYTDVKGNAAVSTNLAAVVSVLLSSTNAKGEVIVSTSLSTAAITASTPTVLTSTNAQGSIVTGTSYLPAILLTATDSRGSQLVTTSPLFPTVVIVTTNTQGSPVLATSPLPLDPQGFQLVTTSPLLPAVVLVTANLQGSPVIATSPFFPAITAPPTLTIGSETVTANLQNQYVIGSQTLTPGGKITVSGTTISLLPDGMGAVVGTSTEKLIPRPLPTNTPPPALTIGSQTVTANSIGQYILGSQTLTPGGIITVSGTIISLSPDGTEAIVGTSIESLTPGLYPTITSPPALIIGSQPITTNSNGQYIFDSQTLIPGGIVTISGTRISLAPDGSEAVVGTSTVKITPRPLRTPPALTIGSQIVTANSDGQYIFGSQTLTPGGVVTISGTQISLAPDGIEAVVGMSTEKLTPGSLPTLPALTIGSETITANSIGQYIFGSQTLTPGGVVTIAGTRLSLAPDGTDAMVGTSTEKLTPRPLSTPPALTVGTQTITANSNGQYIFGSQTLTPGGVITIAGTRLSLAPDGTDAVVGTSTEKLTARPLPTPPALTVGTQTITANSNGQYIFGSQTLTPGGAVTISGTQISLAPDGTEAMVGTSAVKLRLPPPTITSPPALTIGSETITANANGQYIFGNQTLTPGGAVTISGTRMSLAPDGTEAVVGTSTEGLGPFIIGGFGGGGIGNPSGGVAFTGVASSGWKRMWWLEIFGVMGVVVFMWI